MFGKTPEMNALALRKKLLLAESELNRAGMVEDLNAISLGLRGVADRAKKYSSVALSASLLIAGLTYFWRIKSAPANKKPSWWQLLLKGAKLGATLWTEFRPRPKMEM
jgi:hypothetical protein